MISEGLKEYLEMPKEGNEDRIKLIQDRINKIINIGFEFEKEQIKPLQDEYVSLVYPKIDPELFKLGIDKEYEDILFSEPKFSVYMTDENNFEINLEYSWASDKNYKCKYEIYDFPDILKKPLAQSFGIDKSNIHLRDSYCYINSPSGKTKKKFKKLSKCKFNRSFSGIVPENIRSEMLELDDYFNIMVVEEQRRDYDKKGGVINNQLLMGERNNKLYHIKEFKKEML